MTSAEPSDLRKTGGSCARAGGGIPLEVESADLGLGLAARPPREPRVWGSQRGRGRRLRSVPGGRGPRAASRWGRGAGLRPPRPPSWSATAQPRPLSRAGARLVAALVARRGPGRSVRGSPCRRCRRRRPSSSAGRSDRQGSRRPAMGSGAAADLGCGKVSQTCVSGRAAADHPRLLREGLGDF